MGIVGFLIGAVLLLYPHFALVHLLDHYIVGNLILISVIIEAFAFIFFYGKFLLNERKFSSLIDIFRKFNTFSSLF